MAKKKGKRRKQSLISKIMNLGLIALAFSPVLRRLPGAFADPAGVGRALADDYTLGLAVNRSFDMERGLATYAPVVAAIAIGKVKSYVLRKFPVR